MSHLVTSRLEMVREMDIERVIIGLGLAGFWLVAPGATVRAQTSRMMTDRSLTYGLSRSFAPESARVVLDSSARNSLTHDSSKAVFPPWRFGTWFAGGSKQMIKTRFGRQHDRSLYLVGFRAELPLYHLKAITIDYTADFLPVIVATANREYQRIDLCQQGVPCLYAPGSYTLLPSLHTAYGIGVVPLGFRARTRLLGPLQFSIGVSGGGTYFNRRIPDPDETRFNFMAEANVGFLLRTRFGAMSFGFLQHHLSNGDIGRVNPAIDSGLWFVGYER